MLKIIPCNPKGYFKTVLVFDSIESADKYVNFLKQDFLLKKAQTLEFLLSKRKLKNTIHSRPKKYLLTREGNHKFRLWEEAKKRQ